MTITIKEIRVVTTVTRTQLDNTHNDTGELKKLKQEIFEELKRKERITHKKKYER